jgi:hypothetical protein
MLTPLLVQVRHPMRCPRVSLTLVTSSVLFACSGSGDKNPPTAINTIPQWTSENHVTVEENPRGDFFSLRASDADGDTVSFTLEGADAALFAVDATSGALRFRRPSDFEAPLDANGDNLYQLTAVVTDSRGARATQALTVKVTNVEFAYEFLSPLPDTIVERERYSRLPIALWMEYDYPERVQILCDGEIMNPASASRMTWTGSIQLGFGRVNVECVFWRGEHVLETRVIPVRHQHVISDDRYLVYDELNDQIMIPHPQRLETLLIDADSGESYKRYPWVGAVPPLQDVVADGNEGGALFTAEGAVQRLDASGNSVAAVTRQLGSDIPAQRQSTLSYDATNSRLYASGIGYTYAHIDVASGAVSESSYAGTLAKPSGSRTETTWDAVGNRLFFASGAATGIETVTPTSNLVTSYGFSEPQRWGEIQYEPSRDQVFISAWSDDQVMRLDLASGNYTPLMGSGVALNAPRTLTLDQARDRLLTISGAQLVTMDPDTGERSVVFDSAVGPGAATGGFAGIWVAADSTRALAMDRQLGRFYQIDLRTGGKTAKTYTWADRNGALSDDPASTDFLPARDFQVSKAKFNTSGSVAAAHYHTRDLDSQENYLDIIFLDNGSSKRLATNVDVVDFSFSRPDDQLMILMHDNGQYSVSIHDLPSGHLLAREILSMPSDFAPLALQKINSDLYLLGRSRDNTTEVFQLAVIHSGEAFSVLTRYNDTGTGKNNDDAGINSLYQDSVLAILLPEQAPKFWDRADGGDYSMDFSAFHGSDQPQDFYTIDDYSELYFFRNRSGLHLCWRSHCAVQAN